MAGLGLHYCNMSKAPPELARTRTLQVFHDLWNSLGRAPSYREVGRALGGHPLGAQQMIRTLVDEGLIVARTRTVLKPIRLSAAGLRRLARAKAETERKEADGEKAT